MTARIYKKKANKLMNVRIARIEECKTPFDAKSSKEMTVLPAYF
jgi:hypothetical protein